jgi:guanylate kinase
MNRKGILFVISGPSGVGKGTLKKALLDQTKDLNLSISATTRPARPGEVHGQHYFFMDQAKFREMIEEDAFLEWAQVYSNLYGTPRGFVLNHLQQGRDVLLEIDIQGALQVKEKMPSGVFIFIYPPNLEELAFRLVSRGQDSKDSIEARLAACENELKHIDYYDYLVVNDKIDHALQKITAIIIAERCKIKNLNMR